MKHLEKVPDAGKRTPKLPVRYDYTRLKNRIAEKFRFASNLCRTLGWNSRTFSQKMNHYIEFSQTDIAQLIDVLGIDDNEVKSFFFEQ